LQWIQQSNNYIKQKDIQKNLLKLFKFQESNPILMTLRAEYPHPDSKIGKFDRNLITLITDLRESQIPK